MMISFIQGDLFSSKAQTLTNTVNCVGIMGKGVALAFKKRFPEMYIDYREQCERGKIQPGILTIYKDSTPWVLNFPTKRHWKSRSRLEDIEDGLITLVENYREWEIKSLAIPALGCGHGGLDWADVKLLIDKYLGDTDMDIEVYEPGSEASLPSEDSEFEKAEPHYTADLFGNPVPPPKKKKKRSRRK